MLTTKANFDDMESEWSLSSDRGEDPTNGGHDIDLELFPDLHLQDLNKKTFSRSVSKESFTSELAPSNDGDEEMINYLCGGGIGVENVREQTKSLADHQSGTPQSGQKIKVVTLRNGIVNGGKILYVEEKTKPQKTVSVNNRGPIVVNTKLKSSGGPSSPTSSVEDSDCASQQGLCMSKNAIAARENRLKKKNHISTLERSVADLESENATLKSSLSEMKETVQSLNDEVTYLRSVLANQSTLSKLLENIPMVPDLSARKSKDAGKTSSSTRQSRKRSAPLSETEMVDSEEDCDCHPQKNICMCSKENIGQSRPKRALTDTKDRKPRNAADHSYATYQSTSRMAELSGQSSKENSGQNAGMRTRSHSTVNDDSDSTGGVCLHVSGSSVSLEFCSSCSHKAADAQRRIRTSEDVSR